MTRLTGIGIRGFRSIKEASLRLEAINVLIGPNGSGKSNLVAIFNLLSSHVSGKLDEYVTRHSGASRLLHYGPKATSKISLGVAFETRSGRGKYEAHFLPAADDRLSLKKDSLSGECNGGPRVSGEGYFFGSESLGSTLAFEDEGNKAQESVRDFLRNLEVFHFHDTSQNGPLRQRAIVDDTLRLQRNGGNLPAFLAGLKNRETGSYRRICSTLQNLIPWFDDFDLETEGTSLLLRCRTKGHLDYPFTVSQLSDGTLRLMALASLLLQPKDRRPPFIILDEPELGLHPAAEGAIARMIRAASGEGTQFLLATQSVTFLNHFQPEDVVVVENENGASTFKRQSRKELTAWLKRYSLGEIWMKNLIGGRP